jgi:hypothetical protein
VALGRDDGDLAQHLCCSAVAKALVAAVMSAARVTRGTDPFQRLISTYRYLTRLGDNHVIATRIVRSLSTIAALSLLVGCSRFDEAKERDGCQKAHPNDQVAADKCLDTSVLEWEKAHAWLPRITHRRSQAP